MNWTGVRALFPERWVRLIPLDPFARDEQSTVYVDNVAVFEILDEEEEAKVSVSREQGYITLVYDTRERHIELEPGTLPREMVRIYRLVDLIYEEAYAVGLLQAGLSELRVADRMHLSLETVQQLKQEKILEQEIQYDDQVEKGE